MSSAHIKKSKHTVTLENSYNQSSLEIVNISVLYSAIHDTIKNLEKQKQKQGFLDDDSNKCLLRLKLMLYGIKNKTTQSYESIIADDDKELLYH